MSHRERGCLERTHEEPEGIARKEKEREAKRGKRERKWEERDEEREGENRGMRGKEELYPCM